MRCLFVFAVQLPADNHVLADLPEARKICGISLCPDCVSRDDGLIDRDDFDASAFLLHALQQARRGDAKALMRRADLAETHLTHCCPFLGGVRHLAMGSCPGDWLHLMYVVSNF